MLENMLDISVIICAYTEKRWNDLVAAVESVKQQTLPPKEIIVVIDHNPTLLKYVCEHLHDVIVIENREAKGLSGARNSGANLAKGTVIAFLDDDAIADPQWIEFITACYAEPQVVGVGGRIEPLWFGSGLSWFPDEFNWVVGCTYRGMPTENTPVRNVIGANMSVRRHILMTIGGFRESFGCNHSAIGKSMEQSTSKWLQHHAGDEETEFCIRVSQHWPDGVWLYTPLASVRHRVSEQRACLAYFLWRCYDEGLGKADLVRLHGAHIGLSSERSYIFKVLPRGVVRGLVDALFHRDSTGFSRAGAIVAGLTMTTTGYLVGSISSQVMALRNTSTTSISQRSTS
jgi:glycosyltransferase involved in cell wall biosynthesis